MEIKLIENLSNEEYHNGKEYKDYWSSSNLKEYIKNPKEAYYRKYLSSNESSPDMNFGSALHDYLASKHIKGQPFAWNIFEPPINPTTREYYGKATKAYADAYSKIENPISVNDMQSIHDIWNMMLKSDYCWYIQKEILKKGLSEPSVLIDGIHKYKYRPDVVTDKYIFDYKTINKAYWDANKLNYRIIDYAYDISAAMYQYFEHQRTGIWKPFIIIWIMKEPPYDILVSDISQYCFENIGNGEVVVNSGANVFLKLKDQHEACQVANCWPGLANQFDDYNGIRIPKFSPRFERGFEQFEINIDNF